MANNSMKTKLDMEQLVAAIKTQNEAFWLHINQALVETPAKYLEKELGSFLSKGEIASAYKKFSHGMHNDELEHWLGIHHT
jgi:hypothetical protein